MASSIHVKQDEYVCPHWSGTKKSCLLNKGGLFIPVADHIKIYCQTTNFRSCQQLIQFEGSSQLEEQSSEEEANRRRYERTQGRHYLRISEYRPNDMAEIPLDDYACTIDLSPGGIRLESNCSLEKDMLVSFYLDESFALKGLRGIGKVIWCRSLVNTPLYHAGVDFVDKPTASKIREHLGLVVT